MRLTHSIDETGVGVVIQTGSKIVLVCVWKDVYELKMQGRAAMKENVGALGRASGERASESFGLDDVGSGVFNEGKCGRFGESIR